MSLQEKLTALRAAAATRIPPDKRAIMERATDGLYRSGILARVKAVGERAPSFQLRNHDGREIASEALLARGPLVLSFFRGSW